MAATLEKLEKLLGPELKTLMEHRAKVSKERLHLPGPDWVTANWEGSDRSVPVLASLQRLFGHGRLAGTGYLSILPVDQGVEHSAGASFAPNPDYFDPEGILRLAQEGGCNAVASTLGVLGSLSRRWAHKIPFIVKANHNELLSYPARYDQTLFAQARQAWDLGAAAVGATIYFGSPESRRQIQEVGALFAEAHRLGMATVLWCYLRNPLFGKFHESADLTGQANHLGATLEADIIKQKAPLTNRGYQQAPAAADKPFGKTSERVYTELTTDHPIDLARYQVLSCYAGRVSLINSGGASGKDDFADAARTALVNKRAGGAGLISGRKTFQRPLEEGVKLFHLIQDVYLCPEITPA